MKLMYIDESGDTIPLGSKGKKHLVLTGCIIDESNIQDIEKNFGAIKKKFYQNEDIEIKSNFLRYANPELEQSSPLKLHSREKYDELEADMTNLLKSVPLTLISVVIDKKAYWNKYPSQNPYEAAYMFLLERFQMYLEENDSLGICIIDPREGQVEKHYFGDEIADVHNSLRRGQLGSGLKKCPNIIEKLLFSQSDKTSGIQLADLYCYPVFHLFEYNKSAKEYWRFNILTDPKLRRTNNKVDGVGLKFFPSTNKNNLRLFTEGYS